MDNFTNILEFAPTLTVSGVLLLVVWLFVSGKVFSAAMVEQIVTVAAGEIAGRVIKEVSERLEMYDTARAAGEAEVIETVARFRRDDELYSMLRQLTSVGIGKENKAA